MGKKTEAGTAIKPENNTQDLEQNNETIAANMEQTPQKTQSPNLSGKGSTKTLALK